MKVSDEYLEQELNRLKSKLKGYSVFKRQTFQLWTNKYLTEKELLLYIFIIYVLTDWDNRHQKFGQFEFNSEILSNFLKLSNSKLRRIFYSLVSKKLFTKLAPNVYKVNNFRFLISRSTKDKKVISYEEFVQIITNSKDLFIENENFENNFYKKKFKNENNNQYQIDKSTYNNSKFRFNLVSSKGNISLNSDDNFDLSNDSKYDQQEELTEDVDPDSIPF